MCVGAQEGFSLEEKRENAFWMPFYRATAANRRLRAMLQVRSFASHYARKSCVRRPFLKSRRNVIEIGYVIIGIDSTEEIR